MGAFNEFFKNLAGKMHLPDFFKGNTLLFNNLFLVLFTVVCLIALLLVIFLVPSKKKKSAKPAESASKQAEPKVADAPAPTAEETAPTAEETAPTAEETAPTAEETAPTAEETAPTAEEETEKVKTSGKYEIVKRSGSFFFLLKANNGQLLLESSGYTSAAGAKKAIDTFKNAVEVGEFSIDEDKNGNFKFILRASAHSQMLYHGETYGTRQSAESAIQSVKNFAFKAAIKQMDDKDEFDDPAAATPVETLPLTPADHKPGGKYEIEERDGNFYFLLKANNGQLLLESPAFTTEQGAKSGIDTFKKAADSGIFVVDVDKNGNYRFILRANARAQMRYFGESYSTRQSAESSVHSVRAFAQKAILK